MQTALINRLTWEDIKEIDAMLCSIDQAASNEGMIFKNEEDYYSEAIRQLRVKYKTLPACRDRYKEILPIAEKIVGEKNRKERIFELTVLRCMVASRLREEGYRITDISTVMKYDHSTVSFYLAKKEDFFSLPLMYEREVRWFRAFDQQLELK